jgi:pyrroline-5-carboxylate reductase
MRIAVVGAGTMGEVIVRCLLANGVVAAQDITVSDVAASRREVMNKEHGVRALSNSRQAVDGADLVVLAVKPRDLPQAMGEIGGTSPQQLVLSIVAGASLSTLHEGLAPSCIVRAMPNMPAQIGEGMTVWTASADVALEQKEIARSVLRSLGEEIYVQDEKYIDMATALSGSGPAYVFLFVEALIDAGVHIGLPRRMAEKLVLQTVLGSTHVLERGDKHPAELRNMVTSPGGTTADALLQLEKGGFRSSLLAAAAAAYEKAKRL